MTCALSVGSSIEEFGHVCKERWYSPVRWNVGRAPAGAGLGAGIGSGDGRQGYVDAGSPNAAAINAKEAPVTAALNDSVAAGTEASAANAKAQYEADRAAYETALVRHDAAVTRTDARYINQQRAYADAMAAWRSQVYACKHGHRRACDRPAPSVADFY